MALLTEILATSGLVTKNGVETLNNKTFASPIISGNTDMNGNLDVDGNINFTGTARRITGDFSNATLASRLMFQTSAANSPTTLGVLPSGTSDAAALAAYANSDPINTSSMRMLATGIDGRLDANRSGAGNYLPMTFYTGGAERLRIDPTSGNVGIGTSSPVAKLEVLGGVRIGIGVSTSYLRLVHDTANGFLDTNVGALILQTQQTNRLLIDTAGNVLATSGALGYGQGAGGAVVQATSKSTAVTLNKPSGIIRMNAAALAAGASVTFTFYNSLINDSSTPQDCLTVSPYGTTGYRVEVASLYAGSAVIRVTNLTGSSLSAEVTIQFQLFKGASA